MKNPMKKLMLWIIALAALPGGGALFAQSLTGTWQVENSGRCSRSRRRMRTP